MITIKSARELDTMARAGRILHATLQRMREIIRPGMSTEDLDAEAERFIRSHPGALPSFKGLYGFPKTLCICIDEEIAHGIPSPRRSLAEWTIVSVGCGDCIQGLHSDAATALTYGEITAAAQPLAHLSEESLVPGSATPTPQSRFSRRLHQIRVGRGDPPRATAAHQQPQRAAAN